MENLIPRLHSVHLISAIIGAIRLSKSYIIWLADMLQEIPKSTYYLAYPQIYCIPKRYDNLYNGCIRIDHGKIAARHPST